MFFTLFPIEALELEIQILDLSVFGRVVGTLANYDIIRKVTTLPHYMPLGHVRHVICRVFI